MRNSAASARRLVHGNKYAFFYEEQTNHRGKECVYALVLEIQGTF